MRIVELLEGKNFNDLDFVTMSDDGQSELNFDLAEDLAFFIKNDDDVYRRHTHHAIHRCLENIKKNKKTSPDLFKEATLEGYKEYLKQYPIRHLPEDLDDETCKKVCKQMHEELCKQVEEDNLKD
jgi:exoribonuclease II